MRKLRTLIARNCKLFFKDKGVFGASLISPLILFFLFVAFLGDVYRESLISILPSGAEIATAQTEGFAGGWLVSSLLSVCSVTIAFNANLIMVQDRVTGRSVDLFVTPTPKPLIALGYYLSTAIVTMGVCIIALAAGLIYLAAVGWFLTAADVLLTLLDMLLLVLFGTALSSVICSFVRSQGGITAVEAIISAGYGFLCGAYMPVSSLAEGIADAVMFLPGTYGTALLHEHLMGGAIDAIGESFPAEYALAVRDGFDCNLYFFGGAVPAWACYLALAVSAAAFTGLYVLLCALRKRRKIQKTA